MLSLVLFPPRWRCRQRAADSTEQSCTKIPFCFGKCLIQLISVYILHFHPAHRVASIIGLSATSSRLQFPKGWKPSFLVPNFLRLKHFELKFFQELEKPSCPVFYVDVIGHSVSIFSILCLRKVKLARLDVIGQSVSTPPHPIHLGVLSPLPPFLKGWVFCSKRVRRFSFSVSLNNSFRLVLVPSSHAMPERQNLSFTGQQS